MKKTILSVLFVVAVVLAGCSDSNSSTTSANEAVERSCSSAEVNSSSSKIDSSSNSTPVSSVSQQEKSSSSVAKSGGKTLVAYFSRTGNTKPLAEYAAEILNAGLFEITAKVPYTDEDIAYYTDCRADREQKDETARPEIANKVKNMDEYDTVFIAHPIWHGIAPRIISTFLESYDFSGKVLVTFCTSASSPLGQSAELLKGLTPNSTWLESRRFAIGTSKEEIQQWIETIMPKKHGNP